MRDDRYDGISLRPALALAMASGIIFSAGAAFGQPMPGCAPVFDRAALAAVDKTRPLGQTSLLGSPFAIAPGVERVEVDVFGAERLIYEVDVTLGPSCNVLRASPRLESGLQLWR